MKDGQHYVIAGYLADENLPLPVASNGPSVPPDLPGLRAEASMPGEYAQAQLTAPPDPIGKMAKVDGPITVERNGVAVALNVGDAVFKADVIETGIDGQAAIVFLDGTTFHLYAGARMVLDEFTCGAEKSSKSALFRIVKGMFGFVAGSVATAGRLIIDTPFVQIKSTAPAAGFGSVVLGIFTFGLIQELKAASADIALLDDDTIDYRELKHGVFEIITKEAQPRHIIVDDPGKTLVFQPTGAGTFSIAQAENTPIQMAQYQSAYHDTHDAFLQGQQAPFIQHYQQQHANAQPGPGPDGNATGTTSTASTGSTGSTGSSTPTTVLASTATAQIIQPVQNNFSVPSTAVATVSPVVETVNTTTTTTPTQQLTPPPTPTPTPATTVLWNSPADGNWNAAQQWSDDVVPASSVNAQIGSAQNTSSFTVTVSDVESVQNLTVLADATVEVSSPGSLTVAGSTTDGGLIEANSTASDPTSTFTGPVTVLQSGSGVLANGIDALVQFVGDSVDNFGTISADHGGNVLFNGATITNESGAIISATNSGTVTFQQSTVGNAGTITANGGVVNIVDGTVENKAGVIEASGAGLSVQLTDATIKDGTVSIAANSVILATGISAINNATINSSGMLETGGTFTLDGDTINGGIITGAGVGNSVINIDLNSTLVLDSVTALGNGTGAADNAGTILLQNTLSLGGSAFTLLLNGTGTVSLNGATVEGTSAGEILENEGNKISGSGQIGNGNGDLALQNDSSGNVTARDGTLNILAGVVNDATMTAASGAILNLGGEVSGLGSTVVDGGGDVVISAVDTQAITYAGVGTLTINPTANFTGAIDDLVLGDIVDFANNTAVTNAVISGSTLTVDERSGGPLSYQIAGALSGNYFAVQSDGNGGVELVLSLAAAAVAPTITGTVGGQTTTFETPIAPFGLVTISDLNTGGTASDTLTITYAGPGTLSGTGLSGTAGDYTLTGTAATLTSEVRGLEFTPVDGVPGTAVTTTFTLSDTSSAGPTSLTNSTTTVTDSDAAVAPTITGTVGGQTTTFETPIAPFGLVTISDLNTGGTASDTLTITYAGPGTLSGTGLSGTAGDYTLTGTAATLTSEVRGLEFTPVDGVPGTAVTTTFTLSDTSSAGPTSLTNSTTTVTDSDAAVAPTITGTVGGQTTTFETPIAPFGLVTISDLNTGGTASDTLTITYAGPGTLSGTGLSGTAGDYTLTGTAATLTSEVRGLEFTPVDGVPGTAVTTTFTLSDTSSAGPTSLDEQHDDGYGQRCGGCADDHGDGWRSDDDV